MGAEAGVAGGVGAGVVLLPLPCHFFVGIPPLWVAGRVDMEVEGYGTEVLELAPVLPAIDIGLFVKA
jgi:hypothetical protein